jgi:alpha-mannosidase
MAESAHRKRAVTTEKRLKSLVATETAPLESIKFHKTAKFTTPEELPLDAFESCSVGFTWERNRQTTSEDRRVADVNLTSVTHLPDELAVGENVWFHLRFSIPRSMKGQKVILQFEVDPIPQPEGGMGPPRLECLCYRDGEPWQAFDDGHENLVLTDDALGGEEFDLLVEAGTTTLWGLLDVEEFVLTSAELFATRPAVESLYYHISVLNELYEEIPEESLNREKILRAITEASHEFSFESDDETEVTRTAELALERLERCMGELKSDLTGYELHAVGHAHIDLAWLWPWSETVRKGARSFSNVLKIMEEYPEFSFIQSQPHLYELIRYRYPEVFDKIEARIDEGRWYPTGALWVESDINIASGESLARQYLLGKRYFREEFDVDPKITFIPDVFGYSGGLPGISQAADCPYFLTQKMSWNEYNDFPHSTFYWEGIDGSSVLSHFPPADTYNGVMSVDEVTKAVRNHNENAVLDKSIYLYGWGDGGGGPTREMLKRRTVINKVDSLPDIEMGSLVEYFDEVTSADADLSTWTGELYLEKHRGTLTTQARTKHNNRKGEFALREAELWSSLGLALQPDSEFKYPHAALERAWKILLFNQFHDILPGSSVADVYVDADRDYEAVFKTTESVTNRALTAIAEPAKQSNLICVTNSLSWTRSPVVEVDADTVSIDHSDVIAVDKDGTKTPVQYRSINDRETYLFRAEDVPALGLATVEIKPRTGEKRTPANPLEASESHLSNDSLHIALEEDGTISVTDCDTGRSLFDGKGNKLVCYRDQPMEFEAWDIEEDLYEVSTDLPAPSHTEVLETGPIRATVRQTREFGDSELVQEISIERESKRIDFRTTVNWQESEQFLKVHFPINAHTNKATYDTHFGHLERETHNNTSWDVARYEEPHQHWVDISEYEYGVAILNDSKYGVHVNGTDVSLSLLRAPKNPDPKADRGTHEFQYAVYPHQGDLQKSGVIEEGYSVNTPTHAVPVAESVEYEPVKLDTPGVIIEAVKQAEDADNCIVVRLYESWGRETVTSLSFGFQVEAAAEANLIEDVKRDIPVADGRIHLELDPFEIRTLIIEFS